MKQRSKSEKKKKGGAYNFLQNSKWGPFWQQAAAKPQNGATLELRGGGGGRVGVYVWWWWCWRGGG